MDSSFGLDNEVALSDDETVTVQQVLETLENAWLNEKFSPELLPHQTDIVDCMFEQISGMEENLEKVDQSDIRVEIHRMELDRIRYVLSSFLRTRLEKIEEFCTHIIEEDSTRDPDERYLSPGEKKFAEEFQNNIEQHFERVALRHMPLNVQKYDRQLMKVEPNLKSYVFLRARSTAEGLMLEGMDDTDEPLTMVKDSQHMALYSGVASLVKNGTLQLI
ncbi:hypothetical protein R5R35_013564 [Gryllus longicercus]|uniref:DNA replication complex GINS protein SLD5 n=1 Tax=Gryllus longicercus TaxID=2509291 RepID=A0AAN9VJJ8_9ORTH